MQPYSTQAPEAAALFLRIVQPRTTLCILRMSYLQLRAQRNFWSGREARPATVISRKRFMAGISVKSYPAL